MLLSSLSRYAGGGHLSFSVAVKSFIAITWLVDLALNLGGYVFYSNIHLPCFTATQTANRAPAGAVRYTEASHYGVKPSQEKSPFCGNCNDLSSRFVGHLVAFNDLAAVVKPYP